MAYLSSIKLSKVQLVFFLLTPLLFFSCNNSKEQKLNDYFFPYEQLKIPQVYVYNIYTEKDTLIEYYKFHSDGQFISVEIFDGDFLPKALIIDEITNQGVKLNELQTVIHGAPYRASISSPLIFPFNSSTEVNCEITTKETTSLLSLTFNQISSVNLNNIEYKCASFSSKTILNGNFISPIRSEIFYAKDVGIILEKSNKKIIKKLVNILTEQEFNNMIK